HHLRDGVHQRAGKDNGTTNRCLEGPWTIFRKTHLAALEVVVEADRDCKAPVRSALGRVVAMRLKVGFVFCRIASHDMPRHEWDGSLDPRRGVENHPRRSGLSPRWPASHWCLQPTPTRDLDGRALAVTLPASRGAAQHVA